MNLLVLLTFLESGNKNMTRPFSFFALLIRKTDVLISKVSKYHVLRARNRYALSKFSIRFNEITAGTEQRLEFNAPEALLLIRVPC